MAGCYLKYCMSVGWENQQKQRVQGGTCSTLASCRCQCQEHRHATLVIFVTLDSRCALFCWECAWACIACAEPRARAGALSSNTRSCRTSEPSFWLPLPPDTVKSQPTLLHATFSMQAHAKPTLIVLSYSSGLSPAMSPPLWLSGSHGMRPASALTRSAPGSALYSHSQVL